MSMKNNRSTIIRQPLLVAFIVLSLVATLSSCGKVNNQDEVLFPISENDKWGFINAKGEVVIKPQYYDVDEFSEGFCAVQKKKDGLFGFIDCTNKMVIRPKYDKVLLGFNKKGQALVSRHGDVFSIDKSGHRINIDGDQTEDPVLGDGLEIASRINQDLVVIKKTDKVNSSVLQGLYDIGKKKVIIQPEYEMVYPLYGEEDDDFLFLAKKTTDSFLVMDKTGETLPIVSESQIIRWGDVFLVETDSIPRLVDKEGRTIKERLVYPRVYPSTWGVLIPMCRLDDVKLDEDEDEDYEPPIGFINKNGEFVIEPQYSYTSLFKNGLAYVEKTEDSVCTFGYIDATGTFVWSNTVLLENGLPPHFSRIKGY